MTSRHTDFDNFISIAKVSVFWLILGLIIHLITRGIWIGLVGLSFVLPAGIKKDRLKFAKEFDHEVNQIPGLNRLIISWEKICSSIFSISFLLFMSVIGGYFFLFVFIIIPYYLVDNYDPENNLELVWTVYSGIVVVVVIIALIDFLTFGMIKKIPYFSKVYLPMTKVVRFTSLSFLYRPIYYAWASHANRWVFIFFMSLFIVANFLLVDRFFDPDGIGGENTSITMYYQTIGQGAYSGYYEDRIEDIYSYRAQIPSDIIDSKVLRLFLPLSPDHEEVIKEKCNYEGKLAEGMKRDAAALDCFREAYGLYIEGNTYSTDNARFQYRQSTKQKGVLMWLDISDLEVGLHDLDVRLLLKDDTLSWAMIPFYKTNTP